MRLHTQHERNSDSTFVLAAARAFYVDWYIHWAEERGYRFGVGTCSNLEDETPPTARWAVRLARKWIKELEAHCLGVSINHLQDEFKACWEGCQPYSEERAGWYAAMEAMGHGVGLFDFGIDMGNMPNVEAYPR